MTAALGDKRKAKAIVAFLRNFRMMSTLRASTLEKIYKSMKPMTFLCDQRPFKQGDPIDGLYFIENGEFEIYQQVDPDQTKAEQKVAKRALSTVRSTTSLVKSKGIATNLQRSKIMLQKIDGSKDKFNPRKQVSLLRLIMLGKHELFGLDDMMELRQKRTTTVACTSTTAKCLFLSKDDFEEYVRNFKFQNEVI